MITIIELFTALEVDAHGDIDNVATADLSQHAHHALANARTVTMVCRMNTVTGSPHTVINTVEGNYGKTAPGVQSDLYATIQGSLTVTLQPSADTAAVVTQLLTAQSPFGAPKNLRLQLTTTTLDGSNKIDDLDVYLVVGH